PRFPQSEGALVMGEGRRGARDRYPALPDPCGQVPVLLPGQGLVESAQLLEKTAFEEAGRLDAVVTHVAGALQRLGRGPEAPAGRDLGDYGRPKAAGRLLQAFGDQRRRQNHVAVDEEEVRPRGARRAEIALPAALRTRLLECARH